MRAWGESSTQRASDAIWYRVGLILGSSDIHLIARSWLIIRMARMHLICEEQ